MTALLVIGSSLGVYYLMAVLTMTLGARVFGGKSAIPTTFWEGGFLWPVLLPIFLGALLLAVGRTLYYWPHAPEKPS